MTNSNDSRYDEFAIFETAQNDRPNEITITPATSDLAVAVLPTIDMLRDSGTVIDSDNEHDAYLYEYNGAQYSVDYDNTVTAGDHDFKYFTGDDDIYVTAD